MRVIITGTPGCGKSTLAKLLSRKLNYELFSLSQVAKENSLVDKNSEVDLVKLKKKLSFLNKKDNYVLEGHLACEIHLPADFVFVLRTNPDTLKQRLKKRKYSKQKIEDNLLSEVLDYCLILGEKNYKKPIIQVDTSKRSLKSSLELMAQVIKGKKKKGDSVRYSLKDLVIK
ncbi:MAG: adenylate kinase family protein [Candidatus Bilamarchaeum sp.]